MTWDVVCHVLQPFAVKDITKTNFEQADTLLLPFCFYFGGLNNHHSIRKDVSLLKL